MPVALLMLLGGAAAVGWPLLAAGGGRSDVKRRLKVEHRHGAGEGRSAAEEERQRGAREGGARPRRNSTPRAIRKTSRGCA